MDMRNDEDVNETVAIIAAACDDVLGTRATAAAPLIAEALRGGRELPDESMPSAMGGAHGLALVAELVRLFLSDPAVISFFTITGTVLKIADFAAAARKARRSADPAVAREATRAYDRLRQIDRKLRAAGIKKENRHALSHRILSDLIRRHAARVQPSSGTAATP
jgi:hypothetical protein